MISIFAVTILVSWPTKQSAVVYFLNFVFIALLFSNTRDHLVMDHTSDGQHVNVPTHEYSVIVTTLLHETVSTHGLDHTHKVLKVLW